MPHQSSCEEAAAPGSRCFREPTWLIFKFLGPRLFVSFFFCWVSMVSGAGPTPRHQAHPYVRTPEKLCQRVSLPRFNSMSPTRHLHARKHSYMGTCFACYYTDKGCYALVHRLTSASFHDEEKAVRTSIELAEVVTVIGNLKLKPMHPPCQTAEPTRVRSLGPCLLLLECASASGGVLIRVFFLYMHITMTVCGQITRINKPGSQHQSPKTPSGRRSTRVPLQSFARHITASTADLHMATWRQGGRLDHQATAKNSLKTASPTERTLSFRSKTTADPLAMKQLFD